MGISLALFTAAATLVIITPGPDSLLVLRNSLRGGGAVGLCTSAGRLAAPPICSGRRGCAWLSE